MTDCLPPEPQARDWVFLDRCPVCGAPSTQSVPFEHAESEVGRLSYLICRSCGQVYQSPYPSRSFLRSYYQGGYHLHMHGQHDPGAKTEWVETHRAAALLSFSRRYLEDVKNHLDVGSSLGKLLTAFRDAFGCESHGVEPASVYRQRSQARGVDVVGRLSDVDESLSNSFDLVSLSHVLEHMVDPISVLQRLRSEWMASDAHLLIEVPNLFSHSSMEFAHLFAFTRSTLVNALQCAGFAPVAVEVHGQPHSRRLPFYVRALAKPASGPAPCPAKQPSVPLIRLGRWLGMFRLRATWAVSSRMLGRDRLTPWAD